MIRLYQDFGAGEIIFNNISRDGCQNGYDMELLKTVTQTLEIPFSMLGGAGNINDVFFLLNAEAPLAGAAAGSLFCLKGRF